jgi:hypothetical protein
MNSSDIVLPESLMDFVQERVAAGGFADVGAYIVGLVEADRAKQGQQTGNASGGGAEPFKPDPTLEAILVSRAESEPKVEMTSADWTHIRREAIARFRDSQAKSST